MNKILLRVWRAFLIRTLLHLGVGALLLPGAYYTSILCIYVKYKQEVAASMADVYPSFTAYQASYDDRLIQLWLAGLVIEGVSLGLLYVVLRWLQYNWEKAKLDVEPLNGNQI
jgi:hypothetical protein